MVFTEELKRIRPQSHASTFRLLLFTMFSILYDYLIPVRPFDSAPVVPNAKYKYSILQEHTLLGVLIS